MLHLSSATCADLAGVPCVGFERHSLSNSCANVVGVLLNFWPAALALVVPVQCHTMRGIGSRPQSTSYSETSLTSERLCYYSSRRKTNANVATCAL